MTYATLMKHVVPLAGMLLAGTSHGAVTQIGSWALGEAGSVSGSGSEIPLVNSINAAQNITQFQNGGTNTISIVTPTGSGLLAPSSTAALNVSATGAGGWFANTTGYGLTADWGVEIYVNAVSGSGGTLLQTDNSANGVSLLATGGNFSFGNGAGGTSNLVGTTAYTAGNWYKIDIIRFGTTNYFFVNNVQVASVIDPTAGTKLNAPMLLFGSGGNGGYSGVATFDQMSAWNFNSGSDSLASVKSAMSIAAVPEPSSYGLLGAGALAAIAWVRRRRRA